jgi:3-oxoacyl-[acyl-carrier protein] reductase
MGITVNAIGPTPIETELIRGIPEEKIQNLLNRQAIKRYGRIEDIINLVDFLIQPESEFITGQVIYLGGVS